MAVAGDSVFSVGDDRRSRQLSRTALEFGSADSAVPNHSDGEAASSAVRAASRASDASSSSSSSGRSSAPPTSQYPARFVARDAVHRIRAGARTVPTVRSMSALSDSQLVVGELVRPSSTLLLSLLTACIFSSSFRVHCGL